MTSSLANPVLLRLLKTRAGKVLGRRLAVVGYDGRRTGQPHELVVLYRRVGAGVRIAVGSPERKRWWRNSEGVHPMTLRLAGKQHRVLAHAERHGAAVWVDVPVLDPHGEAGSADRVGLLP